MAKHSIGCILTTSSGLGPNSAATSSAVAFCGLKPVGHPPSHMAASKVITVQAPMVFFRQGARVDALQRQGQTLGITANVIRLAAIVLAQGTQLQIYLPYSSNGVQSAASA